MARDRRARSSTPHAEAAKSTAATADADLVDPLQVASDAFGHVAETRHSDGGPATSDPQPGAPDPLAVLSRSIEAGRGTPRDEPDPPRRGLLGRLGRGRPAGGSLSSEVTPSIDGAAEADTGEEYDATTAPQSDQPRVTTWAEDFELASATGEWPAVVADPTDTGEDVADIVAPPPDVGIARPPRGRRRRRRRDGLEARDEVAQVEPAAEDEALDAAAATGADDDRQRLAAEQAEAERIEADRAAAQQAEDDRLERLRFATTAPEDQEVATEQAQVGPPAGDRAEAERLAAEQAEAERLAGDRAEAERMAAEHAEAERIEADRAAAQRAEDERLEQLRLEQLRLTTEQADQVERTRLTAVREAAEQAERDRLGALRTQEARLEQARQEARAAEHTEAQRLEQERLAAEQAAAEPAAAEQAAAERAAAEQAERERRAKESTTATVPAGAAAPIPRFIEFRSTSLLRWVVGAVFVVCAVAAVIATFRAVSAGSSDVVLAAVGLTALAMLSWWALLRWTPPIVSVSDGLLEVSRGATAASWDLRDPATEITFRGRPSSRSWRAVLRGPSGRPTTIRARQVDPAQFVDVVEHYQAVGPETDA